MIAGGTQLPGQRLGFGRIEAHREVERPLRRRQPVLLLVLARALVLEIEIERTVGIVLERHPAADREPVEAVGNLETLRIVERDRPERLDRRRRALLEMQHVLAGAVERPAGLVAQIERIDRVFRQVRAETKLRNDGALEVVVAVDAHRIGVQRPVVDDAGKGRDLPFHQLAARLPATLVRPLRTAGDSLVEVEALARLDADQLHPREDGLIRDVRRMELEQLGRIGEVFRRRHGIDLNLRRRFHVDGWIDLDLDRLGRPAPFGQRRNFEAGLNLVDRIVVGRPVGLGAPDRSRRSVSELQSAAYP